MIVSGKVQRLKKAVTHQVFSEEEFVHFRESNGNLQVRLGHTKSSLQYMNPWQVLQGPHKKMQKKRNRQQVFNSNKESEEDNTSWQWQVPEVRTQKQCISNAGRSKRTEVFESESIALRQLQSKWQKKGNKLLGTNLIDAIGATQIEIKFIL